MLQQEIHWRILPNYRQVIWEITTDILLNPVTQYFGINMNKEQNYEIDIVDLECDKNRRLRLEEAWIFILKSLTPSDLNTK